MKKLYHCLKCIEWNLNTIVPHRHLISTRISISLKVGNFTLFLFFFELIRHTEFYPNIIH